jgi:uncharacterized membrane protein SirB2
MEEGTTLKHLVFLFHLLGFGTIVGLLISGAILEKRFKKAETIDAKIAILQAIRQIGLLSPFAVVVLIGTGIGNMSLSSLGPFSAGWLTAKIIFFAIAIVNGAMAGARGGKRAKLLERLSHGENIPNALSQMQQYNKQHSVFYVTQTFLILIVLVLSVFKPD